MKPNHFVDGEEEVNLFLMIGSASIHFSFGEVHVMHCLDAVELGNAYRSCWQQI